MNPVQVSHFRLMMVAMATGAGVPSLPAQGEYQADGTPTALEEEIRWHVNRGRFDRARENAVRGTAYTDIPATSGPLAPHEGLSRAARRHSEDMAKKNKFQHETIPGSAYYNAVTQPEPWDRFEAEGYDWNGAGENISAGNTSAEAAYVAWWKSTGHRQNMGNPALREIGNGYFFWAPSTYDHYYTMDLGASAAGSFFTDTHFIDSNADSSYDQGEGVGGVRVSLRVLGAEHSFFDVSTAVGSFAVPIGSIAAGSKAEVWLVNQNTIPVSLSIPKDYTLFEKVTLAPGESRLVGILTQPGSASNIGFRNLASPPPPITPPVLSLTKLTNESRLSWPSQTGLQYLPQWSPDLASWVDIGGGYQEGSGGVMTQSDATSGNAPQRFYRLVVRLP